jgi:hypothetical protein
VDLVDHGDAHVAKQVVLVGFGRDQHRLKRLRRGQQHIWRVLANQATGGLADVAVPHPNPPAHQHREALQPLVEVVEQRAQRAHVQHRQAAPILVEHPRQQRKEHGFGLAASRGRQQQGVGAAPQRPDRLLLQRPQR